MNRDRQVYLDYAATTPLDNRVLTEMLPYFTDDFGNPSSVHSWGQRAEAVVESAREKITLLLNAGDYQVVFTSGGTESDNLAIKGAARSIADQTGKRHLLISPVEHPAVSRSAEQLMREGFELEWLPVDSFGFVDPAEVARRIR
ncbi:MAG TPA: aminotransferase class V-fold PLP-dependent enzyme, partial [Anaerolineaceae bacterium]|nr:aminotransferase class V-fold PLP-dependent enzyme [Anaerolineaceae bacterium]